MLHFFGTPCTFCLFDFVTFHLFYFLSFRLFVFLTFRLFVTVAVAVAVKDIKVYHLYTLYCKYRLASKTKQLSQDPLNLKHISWLRAKLVTPFWLETGTYVEERSRSSKESLISLGGDFATDESLL